MDKQTALQKLSELRPAGGVVGVRTQGAEPGVGSAVDTRPSFGLGLAAGEGAGDYRIAVRVQDPDLLGSQRINAVVSAVGGEADIQFVGVPRPFADAAPPPTKRTRPLQPGCSISTVTEESAGTLGCFVADGDGTYVLSNAHVLADHGTGAPGLVAVQPGRLDGGTAPTDDVAQLSRFVPVDPTANNLVDCAVAELASADGIDPEIPVLGRPTKSPVDVDIGEAVAKRGRSTNVTTGVVTGLAIELVFDWPTARVKLTDLLEITSEDGEPDFGAPGDSGSLIVRSSDCGSAGLLVGGGRGPQGLTVYATPLATVLSELRVSMV